MSLAQIGAPIMTIYLIADIGSIGGGWLPSFFIRRGWSVNAARKFSLLVCALAVVPVAFANEAQGLRTAVRLISLAASAYQGFSRTC